MICKHDNNFDPVAATVKKFFTNKQKINRNKADKTPTKKKQRFL